MTTTTTDPLEALKQRQFADKYSAIAFALISAATTTHELPQLAAVYRLASKLAARKASPRLVRNSPLNRRHVCKRQLCEVAMRPQSGQ